MINIEIDRLTNSIINATTGDIFETEIFPVNLEDLKSIKNSWQFEWVREMNKGDVYKLVIEENPSIIQGLLSLIDQKDNVYVSLIENAPFNIGSNKIYEGVAGNLFAYACKVAFEKGYDGYISFHAKTTLTEHYKKTLGAKQINGQLLYIDTKEAMLLVNRYSKQFEI